MRLGRRTALQADLVRFKTEIFHQFPPVRRNATRKVAFLFGALPLKIDGVDSVIDALAAEFCKLPADPAHLATYRESLRALVRLAKSQVYADIQTDMRHANIALNYGPTR